MKRRSPKRKSERSILTAKLDKLWLEILKKERGEKDEIDGRPANGLGVFHILCKGNHPRLRYYRGNCLLVNWMPHHFNWHHYTHNDRQYQVVEEAIVRLRGKDYKDALLMAEQCQPQLTVRYMRDLLYVFAAIKQS